MTKQKAPGRPRGEVMMRCETRLTVENFQNTVGKGNRSPLINKLLKEHFDKLKKPKPSETDRDRDANQLREAFGEMSAEEMRDFLTKNGWKCIPITG